MNNPSSMIPNRLFRLSLAGCLATYIAGMFLIPLMDIDAAQYASISREMLVNHHYLWLYDLGKDYLDKPPMLFWLSALSMRIFGVHDWAYRFPSLLFALLAVYATYRLALRWYGKDVARLSAMILASSQAMFLITHDVRCDTMLMGWVAAAIWLLSEWYATGKWKYCITGFIAVGGGMLTKGPIALVVPVCAFLPHFILRREWKQFFRWEYIIGLLIIAAMLLPMSIGLYQQFDQHPGKLINGVPIQSGLRFYYWTQSFGRYTGENVFHEMNDFTFLLQNMLWSFLPWIIFFLAALGFVVRDLYRQRFRITENQEWLCAGGFILTYCILGRSQAQLPHYIFVVFPLAAILTAVFLHRLLNGGLPKWQKPLQVIHQVIFVLLWLAAMVLIAWPFPVSAWCWLLAGCCAASFLILFFRGESPLYLLSLSLFTVIGINALLDTGFYPALLQYQLGNTAAAYINQRSIPKNKVRLYGINEGRSFHFYGKNIFQQADSLAACRPDNILLTQKDSVPAVLKRFPEARIIKQGSYFGVSMLTLPFLNPATRYKEVQTYVLVALDGGWQTGFAGNQ